MKKFDKPTTFHMTSLDKEILTHSLHDIDLWARGYFDGMMFPYQRYFYHSPQKNKLLIAGIRTGKSFGISRGFLHKAQFFPHSRFLNTSISSEQAKIVYSSCLELCSMPRFQHWVEHAQSSPYPMIRLVNGSELWFRSLGYDAELIRGFEFDWINVDEAAYVTRESAIKTLMGRLLGYNTMTQAPRLGLFTMVSSPRGQGWLLERWKKGDPQYSFAEPEKYLSLRATIWDNPLIDREEIERIMAEYTDAMIKQELYGEFLANTSAVFPYDFVLAGCDDSQREVKWLYDQIDFWKARHGESRSVRSDAGLASDITHYECEPQAGHRYVSSWDLGKKPTRSGRNATVGMVFDITHEPWLMVAYLYREGMGYVEAKSNIEQWHEKYSSNGATCRSVIDSTGKGDVLQEFMEREHSVDDLEGIVYSGTNKPNLIHAGKLSVERTLTRYPFIRTFVDQMTNYELLDKDLAQDTVMCYCQAMYAAREMTRISDLSRPSLQQALNDRPHYTQRTPQVRLNPRYAESRLSRRALRQERTTQTRSRRLVRAS